MKDELLTELRVQLSSLEDAKMGLGSLFDEVENFSPAAGTAVAGARILVVSAIRDLEEGIAALEAVSSDLR